jgi:hypothetical protein
MALGGGVPSDVPLPGTGAAVDSAVEDGVGDGVEDEMGGFDEVRPEVDDPEQVTDEKQADASEGAEQSRQFLRESSNVPGEPEPVVDAGPAPVVPVAGPPALSAAAATCTAKGWHAKSVSAFDSKDALAPEFLAYFQRLPKAKEVHCAGSTQMKWTRST